MKEKKKSSSAKEKSKTSRAKSEKPKAKTTKEKKIEKVNKTKEKKKTNDELILDYENNIRKEIEETTPLISEELNINKLIDTFLKVKERNQENLELKKSQKI